MWDMTREEAATFANEHSIPAPASFDASVQDGCERLGTLDDLFTCAGPWTEPSEEIYALDEIAARLSGAAGVCRDRIRVRATAAREQHRDAAARDDREPRNDRRSPRRRAHRPHGDAADRRSGARDLRSSGRGRAACRAPRAAAARHAIGSRAGLPRARAHVCRSDKRRPVVLADAHRDRCVRCGRAAARHRRHPFEAVQGRLPRRRHAPSRRSPGVGSSIVVTLPPGTGGSRIKLHS